MNAFSKRRRNPEDKEMLRQQILETAKELFIHHGYEAISIRKIADKLKISPTTLYLYYQDKTDIIFSLHQVGFKLLAAYFQPLQNVDNPFERLKAIGRSYLQFALANPAFYDLMFLQKEPFAQVERSCVGVWQEGENAFEVLKGTIVACQAEGYFSEMDSYSATMYIWATVHGLCSLKLKGQLDHVVASNFPSAMKSFNIEQVFDALVIMANKSKLK